MAVSFMLAWPYGDARVMSSYYWDRNMVNGQVSDTLSRNGIGSDLISKFLLHIIGQK